MYTKTVIVFLLMIIILAIVLALILTKDEDIGDFNIKYVGNAKNYQSIINQGVNRWSSIGVKGIYIEFRTVSNLSGNVLASTLGNVVTLSQQRFDSGLSTNIKILTIAHEVGHALGIGAWNDSSVLTESSTNQLYLSNNNFPKTAKAYVDNVRPSGITLVGAPIESQSSLGSGSYKVHWENNPSYGMQKDLMVYNINASSNIISIIDLTYLHEIGREVDLSQAQSLKGSFSSVISEYIFAEDKTEYRCGTCENHKK